MKVALVTPGSRAHVENARYRALFPQLLPMATAYLAAVLEEDGVETLLVDQVPAGLSNEELARFLARQAPDLIGLSLLTTTVEYSLELVALLRRHLPDVPIVLGNQHATLFAEELLANGAADYIVRGEGEYTLRDTVRALRDGGDLAGVAGLSYRDGDRIVHNPDRPVIEDLDTLPFPAWHKVDLFNRAYMELPIIGVFSTPVSVMASRGCPFHCVFCSQDKQYKHVRLRRVDRVVDEIEHLVDRYGIEWVTFNDAYFPWTREQGFQFADEMIRRGLHQRIRWITESRVDRVDDALLRRLREAGLSVIFFGFESGNQAILDRAGKRTTLAQARQAARAARQAGITLMGFFMLGLPGDTVETCWQTVDFAIELDCDFAKFAVTVPYPGSQLYAEQRERFAGDAFEKFTSWYDWAAGSGEVLCTPDSMTADELVRIQRLGMLKFYARPRQVVRHLTRGTLRPRDMALGARVLLSGATRTAADHLKRAFPSLSRPL